MNIEDGNRCSIQLSYGDGFMGAKVRVNRGGFHSKMQIDMTGGGSTFALPLKP